MNAVISENAVFPMAQVKVSAAIASNVARVIFLQASFVVQLTSYIAACISMVMAASSFQKDVHALAHVGADATARVSTDSGKKLLAVAAGSKAKCVTAEMSLLAASDKLKDKLLTEKGNGKLPEDTYTVLVSMADLKLWSTFTFRSNEIFEDCVARNVVQKQETFDESIRNMNRMSLGFAREGGKFWRRDLQNDASLADLREAMKVAKDVEGVQLRKLCDEILEASSAAGLLLCFLTLQLCLKTSASLFCFHKVHGPQVFSLEALVTGQ